MGSIVMHLSNSIEKLILLRFLFLEIIVRDLAHAPKQGFSNIYYRKIASMNSNLKNKIEKHAKRTYAGGNPRPPRRDIRRRERKTA